VLVLVLVMLVVLVLLLVLALVPVVGALRDWRSGAVGFPRREGAPVGLGEHGNACLDGERGQQGLLQEQHSTEQQATGAWTSGSKTGGHSKQVVVINRWS